MELINMQISGPCGEILFHRVLGVGESVFLQLFQVKWALWLWPGKTEWGTGFSSTVLFCHLIIEGRLDHITVSLRALSITHGRGLAHCRTSLMDGGWMDDGWVSEGIHQWLKCSWINLDDPFSKVNIPNVTYEIILAPKYLTWLSWSLLT